MPQGYEGIDPEEYAKSINALAGRLQPTHTLQAARILNGEQLTAFNEIQQWQKEMRDNMAMCSRAPGSVARVRRGMAGGNAVMFSTVGVLERRGERRR